MSSHQSQKGEWADLDFRSQRSTRVSSEMFARFNTFNLVTA